MKLRIALAELLLLLLPLAYAQATDGVQANVFPKPSAFGGVLVQLGWYNQSQAWFFCAATNSISFTGSRLVGPQLTLTPKLSSALTPRAPMGDIAARPVYMVANFQNPPVFSSAPGQASYSALWQVYTVTWKRGVTPRPITDADPASPANPTGLPDASEADIVATQVVLDCPILVLGPLSQPKTSNPPNYIIPQSPFTDPFVRAVFLPVWLVYCQNPVTKRVEERFTLITDAADPGLASVLGANLAPGLLNVPDEDTSDFYVMREPKPVAQLPILSDCPTGPGPSNFNFGYSPVMRYVILGRNIPPSTLIKTPDLVDHLLFTGGLILLKDDQRINASAESAL